MDKGESLEDLCMVSSTWMLRRNRRVRGRVPGGGEGMAKRAICWPKGSCLIIKFHDGGTLPRVAEWLLYNFRGRNPSLSYLIRISAPTLARHWVEGLRISWSKQIRMIEQIFRCQRRLRAQSHS